MTFTGIPNQSRGANTAAYKITVGNALNAAAVTANEDITDGFRPGGYWLQTVGPEVSAWSDNTATAAVWTAI